MAIGAHQRVWEKHAIPLPSDLGQILKIHLMHDAGGRRDDSKVVESLLSPLEKLVSFAVAFELLLGIDGECHAGVELVHLNGVVNDQVARDQRIDLARITAQ